MKENFLKNWRGPATFGKQNQWMPAQGSSLDEQELKTLNAGGVVEKEKTKTLTKLFVRDEEGKLWSVIVRNIHLTALENNLKEVGYLLPAA